jgi:membrane-associated protease RseP (regulator of RpoE activity)
VYGTEVYIGFNGSFVAVFVFSIFLLFFFYLDLLVGVTIYIYIDQLTD